MLYFNFSMFFFQISGEDGVCPLLHFFFTKGSALLGLRYSVDDFSLEELNEK